MKKRNIVIVLISICLIFLCYILLPRVIIKTPEKYMSEIGLMIVYNDTSDKYDENQVIEIVHHPTRIEKNNSKSKWFFPILKINQIDSVILHGDCYLFNCNDKKSLQEEIYKTHPLLINSFIISSIEDIEIKKSDLYFFRIYAEFSDDASFKNVYIKKYPWSKKEIYNFNSN